MRTIKLIFIYFSIIILVLFSFLAHEQAHVEIYNAYNISSKIAFSFSSVRFETTANKQDLISLCVENSLFCDNIKNLHLLNEILAYNLFPIELLLLLLLFFEIYQIYEKND